MDGFTESLIRLSAAAINRVLMRSVALLWQVTPPPLLMLCALVITVIVYWYFWRLVKFLFGALVFVALYAMILLLVQASVVALADRYGADPTGPPPDYDDSPFGASTDWSPPSPAQVLPALPTIASIPHKPRRP